MNGNANISSGTEKHYSPFRLILAKLYNILRNVPFLGYDTVVLIRMILKYFIALK